MPLNPEYLNRMRMVAAAIEEMAFTILVWGPGVPADTDPGRKRERIRRHLQAVLGAGATVTLSEDDDPELIDLRNRLGELPAEYVQLRSADAVILIPESPGSITEAATFSSDLRRKTIAFAERRRRGGFASRAYSTLKVEEVEREEWGECSRVTRLATDFIQELRLEKFRRVAGISFHWEA